MYKPIKKYKVPVDPLGFYNKKNKNKPVIIPNNHITMEGINHSVLGIDDLGNQQLMKSNNDYIFPGSKVLEIPIMQQGGGLVPPTLKQISQIGVNPNFKPLNYNFLNNKDNTKNQVSFKKLTQKELKENAAINKQNQSNTEAYNRNVILERNKNKQTKGDFSGKNPFHIEDKLRLFPNSVGSAGQIFDEYINPAFIVGQLASNAGNSINKSIDEKSALPLASSLAMTAGVGALGFDPAGSLIKKVPLPKQAITTKINPYLQKEVEALVRNRSIEDQAILNMELKSNLSKENGWEPITNEHYKKYNNNKKGRFPVTIQNEEGDEFINLFHNKEKDKYWLSANMGNNKVAAGKSYLSLMEDVPKGGKITEFDNLSLDSYKNFNNLIKKKDKFKNVSDPTEYIKLNNLGTNSGIKNIGHFNSEIEAQNGFKEVNNYLKNNNLTTLGEPKLVQNKFDNSFHIEIPKPTIEKLFKLGGTMKNNFMQQGGFKPLYKKTLDDFNFQLKDLSTPKNAFAYSDENGQVKNPRLLDTTIAQTSFPENNLIEEELDINNSVLDKKADLNKSILGKDYFTEKKESIKKNEDYSYIPSLVNGVLGAVGNRLEQNRQDEYTRNNLANPFSYLPINSNTNEYVNKGVQIAQEGGYTDEEDDWDFDFEEEDETPQFVDDSPYLSEELMSQQEDEDEPIFMPDEDLDITSIPSNNTTPTPNYSIPESNNTLTDESGFDLYMKHQQGSAGFNAISKAAETGKSWKDFYKGEDLSRNMKSNVYSDFYKKYSTLNESNFIDYWKGKYNSKVKEGANKKTALEPFIEKEAAKYGFTPEYVKGIINIESGFNPKASTGSYKGLLQLSNKEFTENGGKDIFDPFDNIRVGLKIIASKRK